MINFLCCTYMRSSIYYAYIRTSDILLTGRSVRDKIPRHSDSSGFYKQVSPVRFRSDSLDKEVQMNWLRLDRTPDNLPSINFACRLPPELFVSCRTLHLTDSYCIFQNTLETFTRILQYYLRSYPRFRKISEELKVLLKRMPLRAIKKCAGPDAGAILHLAHKITAAWYLFNYLNCIVSYPRCDNSLLLCKSVVSEGTERVLPTHLCVKRDEGDENGSFYEQKVTRRHRCASSSCPLGFLSVFFVSRISFRSQFYLHYFSSFPPFAHRPVIYLITKISFHYLIFF